MNPIVLDTLNVMHGILTSENSTEAQKNIASKVVDNLLVVIETDSERFRKQSSNLTL